MKLLPPAVQFVNLCSDDEDLRPKRQRGRKQGFDHPDRQGVPRKQHLSNFSKAQTPGIPEIIHLSSDEEDLQPRRKRARGGDGGVGNKVSSELTLNCKQEGAIPLRPAYKRYAVVVCELCRDSRNNVCEGLCGCNHRFCLSCLRDHVMRVVNDTIDPPANKIRNLMPGLVPCPSLGGCSGELSRQEVARVIGKEDMQRFEDWLVQASHRIYTKHNLIRSKLSMAKCIVPKCGASTVEKSRGSSLWKCATCHVTWCYACGRQFKYSTPDVHANCTGTRRYGLYLELLAVAEMWKDFVGVSKTVAKRASKNTTKRGGGTGYGGSNIDFTDEQKAAQRRDEEFHCEMQEHCSALRHLLDRCSTSGRLNPATWALLQSPETLATLISQLMSNDSILDISSKSSCYLELMALLKSLGRHDGLLPHLLVVSRQEVPEDGPLPFSSLEKLYEQSKLMLSRLPDGGRSMAHEAVDIQLALGLCESYETLNEQWAKHGYQKQQGCEGEQGVYDPVSEGKCKGNANCNYKQVLHDTEAEVPGNASEADSLETVIADYKRKLQPLQFRCMSMVDKSGVYRSYHVQAIMNESSNYTNRSRMLSIAKELASLATSLPLEWGSSIYLCVDEARTDVMKALIVGPQGTPYQNGMFIFDLFLPADYPHAPPKVHFLTTGGGSVRFNPNLYANGHVCLSLLGTWPAGPRWMPGKSTLLQVLVSLQSLVFVEEPYYNEPGFEGKSNPRAAEAENARLRSSTLSIAVLGALRKPEPLFADIILEHFRFKRGEVAAQCDDWVKKGLSSAIGRNIKNEFRRRFG